MYRVGAALTGANVWCRQARVRVVGCGSASAPISGTTRGIVYGTSRRVVVGVLCLLTVVYTCRHGEEDWLGLIIQQAEDRHEQEGKSGDGLDVADWEEASE